MSCIQLVSLFSLHRLCAPDWLAEFRIAACHRPLLLRSRPPAPTPRQDKVVEAAVSVVSGLHLTRRSRKQLWSHCLRRVPPALDRGDDRRFGVRRIEQDHVAANSKLVSKAAELVDIVLRLHEPY